MIQRLALPLTILVFASPVFAQTDTVKTFPDEVKKIMDDGVAGKYQLGDSCPSDVTDAKSKVKTDEVIAYVDSGHKGVMTGTPTEYPDQNGGKLGSIADAAGALLCQIRGDAGKPLPKKRTERWAKIFEGIGAGQSKVISGELSDMGFLLLRGGNHNETVDILKTA